MSLSKAYATLLIYLIQYTLELKKIKLNTIIQNPKQKQFRSDLQSVKNTR